MNIISILKYILHSASYGVMFAVVILLLFPQMRGNSISALNIFQEPPPQALSYARAVNIAGPAVVNIYSTEIQTTPRYNRTAKKSIQLGSGVIMESSGYILTNFHVVQNANLIQVLTQNGHIYPAELIGFDVYTDLAVLKVNAVNLPVIPQNNQKESLAGDIVLAIGNPFNLGQTVTQGIISATGRNGLSNTSYLEFLQMDAAINEGNSGGALVDSNGVLVGINSRKFTQSNQQLNIQGIFFAVPYQLAYKIMQKIIENGRVVRGWLGVSAREYRLNVKGFVIDKITSGSPAFIAGLKSGDVIYQIGETEIASITQALDLVAETKPNTTVIFKVYRDKQQLDVPVLIIENKQLIYNQ